MVMEEIKQSLGVHPRMPNWETHHMGTGQSLVSPSPPAVQITLLRLHASRCRIHLDELEGSSKGRELPTSIWKLRCETPCTVSIIWPCC